MKTILTFLLTAATLFTIHAQDDEFKRDGKFLVETGYNIVGGFSSGSGMSLLLDFDGDALTTIGFDGGKFISENFAIKTNISILNGGGLSLTTIAAGGKYYAGGNVPIQLLAGITTASGESFFNGKFSVGYGIRLADNINFEPSATFLILQDSGAVGMDMTFSMFL